MLLLPLKLFAESSSRNLSRLCGEHYQVHVNNICLHYNWLIDLLSLCIELILPYSDKRKQLLKMKFLVNEQNVSVMYIDINACLDINIFQQVQSFCSKLGLEVEYSKSNLNTLFSQIWVICHLLPFVRVE